MRLAIAVVSLTFATTALLNCHPPDSARRGNTGSGSGDRRAVALPPDRGSAAPQGSAADVPIKDIGCLAPTCAYHPGTNQYFTCQSGGAGTCFHFGAACTPDGGCMFEATSKTYKTCTKPVEGMCEAWGAVCTPASKCMFDPARGLHYRCEDAGGGACKRFGALCAP